MGHKEKILRMAKGFRGRAKNCYKIAKQFVEKGMQYSYRHRRARKGDFNRLWNVRINAGARLHDVKYSQFIHALGKANIALNRKMLAELSINEPYSFKALVEYCKQNHGEKITPLWGREGAGFISAKPLAQKGHPTAKPLGGQRAQVKAVPAAPPAAPEGFRVV